MRHRPNRFLVAVDTEGGEEISRLLTKSITEITRGDTQTVVEYHDSNLLFTPSANSCARSIELIGVAHAAYVRGDFQTCHLTTPTTSPTTTRTSTATATATTTATTTSFVAGGALRCVESSPGFNVLGVVAEQTLSQCLTTAHHLNELFAACDGGGGGHELTCTQFGLTVFFTVNQPASRLPLLAILRKVIAEFTRETIEPAIRSFNTSGAYFVEDKDACADAVDILENAQVVVDPQPPVQILSLTHTHTNMFLCSSSPHNTHLFCCRCRRRR